MKPSGTFNSELFGFISETGITVSMDSTDSKEDVFGVTVAALVSF
jgi:hypothetical protein